MYVCILTNPQANKQAENQRSKQDSSPGQKVTKLSAR